MPAESDVATVRRLYAATEAGDLGAIEDCFHGDAVWHLPGSNAIAGAHRGWPAIRDGLLAKQVLLSGGTFRPHLLDLAVGDQYVVAVVHATARNGKRRLDQTVCQLMRLEHGKIIEVRGHYSDEAALNAFWAQEPAPTPDRLDTLPGGDLHDK